MKFKRRLGRKWRGRSQGDGLHTLEQAYMLHCCIRFWHLADRLSFERVRPSVFPRPRRSDVVHPRSRL